MFLCPSILSRRISASRVRPRFGSWNFFFLWPLSLLFALSITGCLKSKKGQNNKEEPAPETLVETGPDENGVAPLLASTRNCRLPETEQRFTLDKPRASATPQVGFEEVQRAIDASCAGCHEAPAANLGGFTYSSSFAERELVIDGTPKMVAGFQAAAEKMRDAIVSGRMPPENIRSLNPAAYEQLGQLIESWIAAGKPEKASSGKVDQSYPPIWGEMDALQLSDLGNCLPELERSVEGGSDPAADALFEQAEALPSQLSLTDLSSMDNLLLNSKGTHAYNVEYPLWNDHARKLRHIHLPAKKDGSGKPEPLTVKKVDEDGEPQFTLPENTRFYKTFFRAVKDQDGSVRYRPVETRLIVVRYPPKKPLFGSYVWREDAADADLLTTPYRDGTAWKDLVLSLDFNRQTGTQRSYLVPARHRCEQCHQGGVDESFVLGFTPLQINRRDLGEAARDLPVGKDELLQVQRFVDLGMLSPEDAKKLPRLEEFPSARPLDEHTLRAQGYALGNCTSCHNPAGFARTDSDVELDMSAGRILNFDTHMVSTQFENKKLVHHEGQLDQSYLFHRLASSETELKLEARMPLHSTGGPDCRGVNIFARWIKTFDPTQDRLALASFAPEKACTEDGNFDLKDAPIIEDDPTEPAGSFKPRREDWNDPTNGMGDWFYQLKFDPKLLKMSQKSYAVDWWQEKPECKFPEKTLAASELRDWMKRPDGSFTKPLGQLYFTEPGAYFYNITCAKCHGRLGEADGPLASNLKKWSGGQIRVANFKTGLFGQDGANLAAFEQTGPDGKLRDLSGNYFIWMALEGTKMNPPPQVAELLGSNKAQMLKTIMDRCARQIPTNPKAAKPYFRDYEIFNDVCSYNNLPPTHPSLQYDEETGEPLNPAALDKWLRKGAANAGWTIYDYVKSKVAKGEQTYPQTECEKVFAP